MKALGIRFFFFAGALSCALGSSAYATFSTLLTMDDLPLQPVHGLAHPSGVEFAFTVGGAGSNDANYASGGPESITFVQDPSIEGNSAGILFVNFPGPANVVRFGVARSVPGTSSATVELFNAANVSLGAQNLALTAMPMFAEGLFSHRGQAVSRFTLSFPGQVSRFAFDNLFFQIVPEPGSIALAGMGIGIVALRGRRRCV